MIVADDVWMSEGGKNRKLGVKLLAFLLGHADVIDLFPTEYLAICLSSHFSNNAKGSMACMK